MAADDRFTEDFRDSREEEVIGTISEVGRASCRERV